MTKCIVPPPECEYCITEPSLDVHTSGVPVGSTLRWSCSEGYIMEGDADYVVWVCGVDMEWIGDKPNCTG